MRLLHVLEPTDGGVARHVEDLVGGLIARGHAVDAIVGPGHGLAGRLRALGAGVAVADLRAEITHAGADARALATIGRLVRPHRWDAVHTHGNKGGVLGRLCARRAGLAVVHSPHAFAYLAEAHRDRRAGALRRAAFLRLERGLSRLTDVIVCVSDYERRRAIADGVCEEGRLAVVRNAVAAPAEVVPDPRLAHLAGGPPVLGFLARLAPEKGPLVFVDALERLQRDGAAYRAALVGNGPQAQEVRDRVRAAGLGDAVTVLPYEGDTFATLARFDAYVLPSRWEALPIGVLEAMRMSLPVVASDVGGVGEAVLDGKTGLLVAAGDAGALASALARLLADPGGARVMGAAGAAHCEAAFSFGAMLDGIEAVYERARRCSSASS